MDEFVEKRKALFDCLDDASKELKGTSLDQSKRKSFRISALRSSSYGGTAMVYRKTDDIPVNGNANIKLSHLQGKESIFKKPELPIGKCLRPSRIPDYQIHPHRWKKYSLQEMDISENSNTTAALAFLDEMDRRKANTAELDSIDEGTSRIEFKKASKIKMNIKQIEAKTSADTEVDIAKQKGRKVIMPEYVVGQSQVKKRKKANNSATRASGTLKLSHLAEEDECE